MKGVTTYMYSNGFIPDRDNIPEGARGAFNQQLKEQESEVKTIAYQNSLQWLAGMKDYYKEQGSYKPDTINKWYNKELEWLEWYESNRAVYGYPEGFTGRYHCTGIDSQD